MGLSYSASLPTGILLIPFGTYQASEKRVTNSNFQISCPVNFSFKWILAVLVMSDKLLLRLNEKGTDFQTIQDICFSLIKWFDRGGRPLKLQKMPSMPWRLRVGSLRLVLSRFSCHPSHASSILLHTSSCMYFTYSTDVYTLYASSHINFLPYKAPYPLFFPVFTVKITPSVLGHLHFFAL